MALVFGLCALVVVIFVVIGRLVGEPLRRVPSLKGYGINQAGSLAGVILFSTLAFFNYGPAVWLLVGFLLLVPFFSELRRSRFLF
jgi:hypothetical protein